MSEQALPIGVFDSGVGGLTVLKAMQAALPQEDFLYLGDTARLPYGTKSPTSIERYACQATAHLQAAGIKLLVVACNTASAVALAAVRQQMGSIPVIGVVEPGADAAVAGRQGCRHLVLATEATVRLHAYRDAILRRDASAVVDEMACEMLVSLAEEGWTDGDIPEAIVRRYLNSAQVQTPDTIILGCTHFPLLRDAIANVAPDRSRIVDSATTTAANVAASLAQTSLQNTSGGAVRLFATDGPRRFARVGGQFLGTSLSADDIEMVDL